MKINMLTRARNLWPESRYNQRAWIKSVRVLGDRWLLAYPINRKTV